MLEIAIGDVFGELTVIGESQRGRRFLQCRCSCGVAKDVGRYNLLNGKIISCGHVSSEKSRLRLMGNQRGFKHGLTKSRAYQVWVDMRQRCENPNSHIYSYYGERGITVCDRWQNFENFLSDMGHPPPNLSLDRIDNSKGYSPDNCRWATKREQQNNRRNNHLLTVNGETKTLSEWSRETGVGFMTLRQRAGRGLSPEETIQRERHANTAALARKARTHCKHGHPFDEANTYRYGNDQRGCRTCRTNAMRRLRAKSA